MRRDINNCKNDTNRDTLKIEGLGASFELYDGHTNCMGTVLSPLKE